MTFKLQLTKTHKCLIQKQLDSNHFILIMQVHHSYHQLLHTQQQLIILNQLTILVLSAQAQAEEKWFTLANQLLKESSSRSTCAHQNWWLELPPQRPRPNLWEFEWPNMNCWFHNIVSFMPNTVINAKRITESELISRVSMLLIPLKFTKIPMSFTRQHVVSKTLEDILPFSRRSMLKTSPTFQPLMLNSLRLESNSCYLPLTEPLWTLDMQNKLPRLEKMMKPTWRLVKNFMSNTFSIIRRTRNSMIYKFKSDAWKANPNACWEELMIYNCASIPELRTMKLMKPGSQNWDQKSSL